MYRLARFGRYLAEYRHLAFGLERKGPRLADGIVAHSPEEAVLKSGAANWLKGFASQPQR